MSEFTESSDEPAWYLIRTKPAKERWVRDQLAEKVPEVFLPLLRARAPRWGRMLPSVGPLFPCYVFLRGGLEQQINILTTPGVLGLVGFSGVPAIIPDTEIEAVRRTIVGRGQVEPYPFLKCGDWVRVKGGPLEGIEGILVRNKSQFRLVLSVQLLQKSAAVEVDAWSAERAPRPERPRSESPFILNACICA